MKSLTRIFHRTSQVILPPILAFYERFLMYRIREAWGKVHLRKIAQAGRNVKIAGYSRLLNCENLVIGDDVRIGYGCFFFCKGGVSIGDGTVISRHVTIYSANHDYKSDVVPYNDQYLLRPVSIGRGVWIGMNVSIAPGVSIGDGSIIGIGATITEDLPAYSVAVSGSTRVVSSRDAASFNSAFDKQMIFARLFPDL